MLVRDVMHRDVFTVLEGERLTSVARELLKRGVRHAPVVREGALVGILSERNVLSHRARFARDGTVQEAMTEEPYVIAPESSLATAAATMTTHKIGCLPVLDGAKLVGIVTTTDVLSAVAQEELLPRAAGLLVAKDVMQTTLEAVRVDDTLLDSAYRMLQRGVRHLPVVDGERRLVGILSDRDVRTSLGDARAEFPANTLLERLGAVRVGAAMTRNPRTAAPDTSLLELGQVLADERIGALPIVDEGERLIGIVSYIDVLHALVSRRAAGRA